MPVVLKTYINSNTEQLGVCSVKLRHEVAKWTFFIVPDDVPVLLGMPDIELLGILNIMCELVEDQ